MCRLKGGVVVMMNVEEEDMLNLERFKNEKKAMTKCNGINRRGRGRFGTWLRMEMLWKHYDKI